MKFVLRSESELLINFKLSSKTLYIDGVAKLQCVSPT